MALRVAEGEPANALQVLSAQITSLRMEGFGLMRSLALQASSGVRVYVAGADQAKRGEVLQARAGGWRYLIFDGAQSQFSGEVDAKGEDNSARFTQVSSGPFEQATFEAINRAETLDQVNNGEYELRYLKIPGVSVEAVWLHDTHGKEDLFLPLLPEHEELRGQEPISARDFIRIMQKIAEARLEFTTEP